MKKNFTKLSLIYLIGFFILSSSFIVADFSPVSGDELEGFWMSEAKDLKIEVVKQGEEFVGKIVWFACDPKTPNMADFKDTNNPNPSLKTRPWLGMVVLNKLSYNPKGYWSGGQIYDPNSGKTFSSTVRMPSAENITVKSFWKIELLSKSLKFNRQLK